MTAQEIRNAFYGKPVFVGGANYAVPAQDWLLGPFYDYFKKQLGGDGLGAWSVRWECRDFARAYACLAQICNALTTGPAPAAEDALAVGEFWFKPDGSAPGTGHAINVCFTETGLTFIEPQTGLLRPVSDSEMSSCYFLRF